MATEYTTVSVILYKSKTLSNGEHPLTVRISKGGIRKHISLGVSCHKDDWDPKNKLPKRSHPNKNKIDAIILKALKKYNDQVIDFKHEEKDFTPDVLITAVRNPTKKTTVFSYFELKIKNLKAANKIGNADIYLSTLNQLKKFTKNKDITFSQIDYEFLVKFETFFRSKGLSDNAISIRFRTLRALFNIAIRENYIKHTFYPFDMYKIAERFDTNTKRRAITKEELQLIEALKIDPRSTAFEAQKYFVFSYYGQGINFGDMAALKWKNLVDGRIFYKRAKTGREINFLLIERTLEIINYWKPVTKTSLESYIFPILNEAVHITATQKHNRIHKVLTRVNRDLKIMAKDLGIEGNVTTYVARHTFATVLKKSKNVNTAVISEAMGHKTEAITQVYLKSFENSIIDEAMENLL